jgi:hypothetical protein
MSDKRQDDAALRHFKLLVKEVLTLFRKSVGAQTVSLHWVNRQRKQFVLESAVSEITHAQFADRVLMTDSYLHGLERLQRPATLEIGKDVQPESLTHYLNGCPISHITVLPLEYNRDVVALAVIESNSKQLLTDSKSEFDSFISAMGHLLHTFLELSERTSDEQQWSEYETMLQKATARGDDVSLLNGVLDHIAELLPTGAISLLARVQDQWQVVLNHPGSSIAPHIGLTVSDHSLVFQALKSGMPEFATHLNGSLKRVSSAEPMMKGASLAIPIVLHDRRQAVVLVSDENLMFFRESNRHKLTNLVRMVALRLVAGTTKYAAGNDFLSAESGCLIADLFDASFKRELTRGDIHVGMVTIRDIQTLRSKHRMDELKTIQHEICVALAPNKYGFSGIVGAHADFVYNVMISGEPAVKEAYKAAVTGKWSFVFAFPDQVAADQDPYDIKRAMRSSLDKLIKTG